MSEAMQLRATSSPLFSGAGAPRWLVFAALVCWAVLWGPAQAQPLDRASALHGFDSDSSITASDRSPTLQTTDRRYHAWAGDGNPTQLATGSIAARPAVLGPTQPASVSLVAMAAQQLRSPAQPRAPPV